MTKPSDILWEVKPHTQKKHEILRRYLGAWFGILGQSVPRIMYLDGFCGPGRYKDGEDGSPIIALKEALKHSHLLRNHRVVFFFIDEDLDSIRHLEGEIALLTLPSNFELKTKHGEFHQVLQQVLNQAASAKSSLPPTFAFIDPFGFKGIPFSLVSQLLDNPNTEVFINVMIDFVNRFIEHPDAQTQKHIIDLFGTRQALDVIKPGRDRLEALRRLYQAQLKKHARFVRYFEMWDTRGRVLYYLFFATNHSLGHTRMKEAFWGVDEASGFRFSDTTDPNQPVLFKLDPSTDLAKVLQSRFTAQTVSVGEIQRYVEDETPYVARHMRGALKNLEAQKHICVSPCKADGKKRRRDTFPENAIIEFEESV